MNKGHFEQIASPSIIYEQPTTRFSASFVGNRNSIEMQVTNGRLVLGKAFDIPVPDISQNRVSVFIRPEDVSITDANQGQSAIVESKIFQGSLTRTRLAVESNGQLIRLYADITSKQADLIEVGSTVGFCVIVPNKRVFPVEGYE